MIDSSASSDFIDTEFASQCGLDLTASDCTIRLADGSVVPASGKANVSFSLTAAHSRPAILLSSTLTATPLEGYDVILGLPWLEEHDVNVGWRNRTIQVRTDGMRPRFITPLECIGADDGTSALGTITVK